MVVEGEEVNPSDVDRFTSADGRTKLASAMLFGSRYKIGHKSGQMLSFKTVGDAAMTIFTAKAAKYKDSRGAVQVQAPNVKLDSGAPRRDGRLRRAVAPSPLKASTKRMLADPKAFDRAMRREQTAAAEQRAESAAGAEGAEGAAGAEGAGAEGAEAESVASTPRASSRDRSRPWRGRELPGAQALLAEEAPRAEVQRFNQ